MKHVRYLTLFSTCLFLCWSALAQAASITLDQEELEAIFTDIQLASSPWPAENLVVSNFSSSPSMITVPLGSLDYELISQAHGDFLGRKSISVVIKVDGQPRGKVKMRGDLELYGDVVILTRRVGRGDVVTADDVTTIRRNITMFSHELVESPQEAIGQGLRASFGPGTILLRQYLKKQPVVNRGDLVTIKASTESLHITTKGEVRSPGAAGDLVQVKNLSSRQMITARVIGPGLVRVEL